MQYDFVCENDHAISLNFKPNDKPLCVICEQCGKDAYTPIHIVGGFVLEGDGFYKRN